MFVIEGELKECELFEDCVGEIIDGVCEMFNGESVDDVVLIVFLMVATTVSNAFAKSRAGVFGKFVNVVGVIV